MTDNYTYFYILNSILPEKTEEFIVDFKALEEFDRLLNELPEFFPEDSVVEKIYKLL
ncbi:MAG TPA: hypothetical protein PKN32_02670 [Bacteroidales bacterium]|nr:hypothetical protein [Bacteroidales bacterium]